MSAAENEVGTEIGTESNNAPQNAENGEQTAQKPQKVKGKKGQHTDDLLIQIVQEISGLNSADAMASVPALLNNADENYFRLGGVLSAIQTNKFFESEGFENFKSFVEDRHGIPYRKAMYWIHIYEALVESGVSWNKVKDVGWTKLKDLASILTVENVDEWVKLALSSTVLSLQDAIAKAKAGTLKTSGLEPTDGTKSVVTTITVKVHADQKQIIRDALDKAKVDAGTEFDGVALEAIAVNFLSGGNVNAKPASLIETIKQHSPEDVLTAFEEAYPQFEVIAKIKKGHSAG